MIATRFGAAVLMLAGLAASQETSPADRAAVAMFERVSGLPQAVLLRRIAADQQFDLVVGLAFHESGARPPRWSTKDRLRILL
jgi:hypothetical protein